MKKRMRILLTMMLLIAVLIPAGASRVKAAGSCKVTVKYDASQASYKMYYTKSEEEIRSGDSLPINDNGWTDQIAIHFKIKSGYRIKSVDINGTDFTNGFVEGAYGGLAKGFDEDSTVKLTVEKIPDHLPYAAGAKIYSGKTKSSAELVGNQITIDENTFKLWAVPYYSDGVSYPDYYISGNWQVSKNGSYWYDLDDYGWSKRTDFWPGWKNWETNPLPFDFLNDKNYYIRIELKPREGYSQGLAYSDAIFVNSDGKVTPVKVENPTIQPSGTSDSSDDLSKGAVLEVAKVFYKITKAGSEVQYVRTESDKAKITIPDKVKIEGKTYKVTSIAANAFKGSKTLKQLKIGKNVSSIGKNAFNGCANLKKVTIKTKKLTAAKVKKNAFKGLHKKAVIKVPASKRKAYKKLLKKRGFKGSGQKIK